MTRSRRDTHHAVLLVVDGVGQIGNLVGQQDGRDDAGETGTDDDDLWGGEGGDREIKTAEETELEDRRELGLP